MRSLLLLSLMMSSCNYTIKTKGGTTHTAESHSTIDGKVEVIMSIDISGCMELPEKDRLPCIEAIVDTLKELNNAAEVLLCKRDLEQNAGNASLNPPVSCRKFIPVENGNSGT